MDRPATPGTDPRPTYADRAARFDEAAAHADRAVRTHGRLRLATFAIGVSAPWLLFSAGSGAAAWGAIGAACLAFGLLVFGQRRARARRRRAELAADLNREGIARVERRWDDLPRPADEVPPVDLGRTHAHDYAEDLDLHGRASLMRLLGTASTRPGRCTLHQWLRFGADPHTVALRQQAVGELAGAFDFRDRLAAEARVLDRMRPSDGEGDGNVDGDGGLHPAARFLRWAEGDERLAERRWLLAAAYLMPPVNVSALALYFLGAVPGAVAAWPLLASLAVLWPCWKRISRLLSKAGDGESEVRDYGPLLAQLHGSGEFPSPLWTDIRTRLGGGARLGGAVASDSDRPSVRPAHQEIRRLRRLLDMADLRRSPLFHLPMALLLFWDVHTLAALERWKARSGHRVREWLRAVGEAEALAALAALATDHPDWTIPNLDAGADTLRGEALGHPLLPPAVCVRNDVEVGPAGSFLLVTGSNMSGKSTLLKAIGLNVALAQAGAPVCADSLRLPSLRVVTSMSVRDSLADGISFFMAELRRLKQVVDAAEASAPERALYLVDEILQGTNSAERQIAARTVVRRLLASSAIGAVTTHDLALADAEDLNARATAVHFTESVRDSGDSGNSGNRGNSTDIDHSADSADRLVFDYRLRPGPATSTNALRLLALVGLD